MQPPQDRDSAGDGISYRESGVDIDAADAAKRAMAASLEPADDRVLNRIGAFASLFEARFPGIRRPVLVLKTEEPGSKQLLAMRFGRVRSLAFDLVNHLINDTVMMGARPLSVQDCIVCGRLEPEVVRELVEGMADACREQDCTLTGGETSEQPGVLAPGGYVLTASAVGVVDADAVIDGSRIAAGDRVLALASNGLHTNGYSLVRALIAREPGLLERDVAGESFLDAVMRPHFCYYGCLRELFGHPGLHGLAHVTGGGIGDNVRRVLPQRLDARVDLGALQVPPVFGAIREAGPVADADMLRTFNMGVGVAAIVAPDAAEAVGAHVRDHGVAAWPVGEVVAGSGDVQFEGKLRWR